MGSQAGTHSSESLVLASDRIGMGLGSELASCVTLGSHLPSLGLDFPTVKGGW